MIALDVAFTEGTEAEVVGDFTYTDPGKTLDSEALFVEALADVTAEYPGALTSVSVLSNNQLVIRVFA